MKKGDRVKCINAGGASSILIPGKIYICQSDVYKGYAGENYIQIEGKKWYTSRFELVKEEDYEIY